MSAVEVRRGPQCSESRRLRSGEATALRLARWAPARSTALRLPQVGNKTTETYSKKHCFGLSCLGSQIFVFFGFCFLFWSRAYQAVLNLCFFWLCFFLWFLVLVGGLPWGPRSLLLFFLVSLVLGFGFLLGSKILKKFFLGSRLEIWDPNPRSKMLKNLSAKILNPAIPFGSKLLPWIQERFFQSPRSCILDLGPGSNIFFENLGSWIWIQDFCPGSKIVSWELGILDIGSLQCQTLDFQVWTLFRLEIIKSNRLGHNQKTKHELQSTTFPEQFFGFLLLYRGFVAMHIHIL